MQKDIVILGAKRTAIGAFQGAFAHTPAPQLGTTAIKGALEQATISPQDISATIMGNVLTAGVGQAPARQAALFADIPNSTHAFTVNKVCSSGMKAVVLGTHSLLLEESEFVVSGGMENMTLSPYLLPKARAGFRIGNQTAVDSMVHDGLWDPYNNTHMGNCAEQCAEKYAFSRAEQDAFAQQSYERALEMQKTGKLVDEIIPLECKDRKGKTTLIDTDEGPAQVNFEKIPQLKPAFQKEGSITAANASTINDGAAALILTTAEKAQEKGLNPRARIVSWGEHSQDPVWYTTAPVKAAERALHRAGWSADEVDLWEVNEAFSVVPMAFAKELSIPFEKLNIRGGAVSLGHPIGCSGARILVTLIAALRDRGLQKGCAAICNGGGEGMALCLEVLH